MFVHCGSEIAVVTSGAGCAEAIRISPQQCSLGAVAQLSIVSAMTAEPTRIVVVPRAVTLSVHPRR